MRNPIERRKRQALIEVQEWALHQIDVKKKAFGYNRHRLITEEQSNGQYIMTIDVWKEPEGSEKLQKISDWSTQAYRLIWNLYYCTWSLILQ